MIFNVRFRTWKHQFGSTSKSYRLKKIMLTRLPGSRDRRVGSNKILNLSRNCPSQPTQFLLYLLEEEIWPTGMHYLKCSQSGLGKKSDQLECITWNVAKVVFCIRKESWEVCVARTFNWTVPSDTWHVCGTNRFWTPDLVYRTIKGKRTSTFHDVHMSAAISFIRSQMAHSISSLCTFDVWLFCEVFKFGVCVDA